MVEELTGAWPSGRSGERQITSDGAMERGVHEESTTGLTGAWVAVLRPSDDDEGAVVVALGGGGA
jgi:hypothetical protein